MMQPRPRMAAEYARVSTRPQEMTASKEVQVNRMDNYALREGMTVKRRFADVGSGLSTKERPQFEAFVDYVCDPANGITDAIVDDLSRFTRSARDYYPYMDRIEKANVTIHSALEGAKVGPDSEFTWGMICLTNERNSRLTSIKTKNNQRAATERGKIMTVKAPYGYMWEEFETSRGTEGHKRKTLGAEPGRMAAPPQDPQHGPQRALAPDHRRRTEPAGDSRACRAGVDGQERPLHPAEPPLSGETLQREEFHIKAPGTTGSHAGHLRR